MTRILYYFSYIVTIVNILEILQGVNFWPYSSPIYTHSSVHKFVYIYDNKSSINSIPTQMTTGVLTLGDLNCA